MGRRGTCAAKGKVRVLLHERWDGGLHQPGLAPDRVQYVEKNLRLGGTVEKLQENRGYGLPTIPGGWITSKQSLHTADDKGGEELLGEAEGAGALYILTEGIGEGVTGFAPPNPSRRGKMGGAGQEGDEERGVDNTRKFRVAFPEKAGPMTCPVDGCRVRAKTMTAMQVHF